MNGRDLIARAEEMKRQFSETIDAAVAVLTGRARHCIVVNPEDEVVFAIVDGRLSIRFRPLPPLGSPPPLTPEAEEAIHQRESGFTAEDQIELDPDYEEKVAAWYEGLIVEHLRAGG